MISRALRLCSSLVLPVLTACADAGPATTAGPAATNATSGADTSSGGDTSTASSDAGSTSTGASTSAPTTSTSAPTTSAEATSSASGSGDATGEPTGPTAPIDIVVLGASTAVGWNLDVPEQGGTPGGLALSWVNRYSAYLDVERPGSHVYNLSKAGYGTYEALPTGTVSPENRPKVDETRNITAALANDPDVIIVHYPSGGDLDNGILVQEIVDNLAVLAATAAAADVPVWVTTPNPLSKTAPAKIAQFLDMRDQILTIYGEHSLDFWALRVGPDGNALPEYTLLDGHHPNAEGHRLLFELVVAAQIPEDTFGTK